MTLVLEIGWSETATEVAVIDTSAHSRVGEGLAPNPDPVDGLVDPTGWWEAAVRATALAVDGLSALGLQVAELREVVVGAGEPTGGLVALDAAGQPVHPAIVGSHLGSGADADWLIGHVDGGADAWLAATDVLPTAGSTVALLSWLHRSAPDAWESARRFTLPAGWVLERLGGDQAVGERDAIGTAVLDHHSGERWRTELLSVVDGDRDWLHTLPTIASSASSVGLLSAGAATELGLPADLPLHVGSRGLTPT